MHVNVSESGQGGCHTVQFILKSFAFLLEFADYRMHQCFLHDDILSLALDPRVADKNRCPHLLKILMSLRQPIAKSPPIVDTAELNVHTSMLSRCGVL